MPVTINDVAKRAGVSPKTVSNVIHDHPHVRESTRSKVLKAIEELGYQPNIAARSLVTKRHDLIGFVLWDILNPAYTEMVETTVAQARESGYMLILGNAGRDPGEEDRVVTLMIQQRVDGIILASTTRGSKVPERLVEAGVPVVLVSRYPEDLFTDYVGVDNVRGEYMMTHHLLRLGHTRIAFMRGIPTVSTSVDREAGYRQALEDHGIAYDESLVGSGNYTPQEAYLAAGRLLSLDERPRAIACANDLMAISVIDAVLDAGLRVPEDVAVTGFDDIAWAGSRSLNLTTIRVGMDLMAREAVSLLLNRIQGQVTGSPREVILPPELVVRRTCGASLSERSRDVRSIVIGAS